MNVNVGFLNSNTVKMLAVCSSEMLACTYNSTQNYYPEDQSWHIYCHEKGVLSISVQIPAIPKNNSLQESKSVGRNNYPFVNKCLNYLTWSRFWLQTMSLHKKTFLPQKPFSVAVRLKWQCKINVILHYFWFCSEAAIHWLFHY